MYFLSKVCFVCRAQGYWIILDAKRDKYLCVTHADLTLLGPELHGWPAQGNDAEHSPNRKAQREAVAESLSSNGVITEDPSKGKRFVDSECLIAGKALESSPSGVPGKPSLPCIARFVWACAKIDWELRAKKFAHTLARIERRRQRAVGDAMRNFDYASELIATFKALRPIYPRPYLCLFDSLALLEFLACYGVLPRVVFGVVADPFQAHCWLQEGATVLNDNIERVGKFKPILSA